MSKYNQLYEIRIYLLSNKYIKIVTGCLTLNIWFIRQHIILNNNVIQKMNQYIDCIYSFYFWDCLLHWI